MISRVKISVIIPVYSVPLDYLQACLNSLTGQTLQECEFIIVSDGASNAECSICEDFTKKDNRFKFYQQPHAGVSATRNFGIEQAHGEYITFVDADDEIEPDTCNTIYSYAKENDSDIVLWDAKKIIEGITLCNHFLDHSEPALSQTQVNDLIQNTIYTTSIKYSSAPLVACKLLRKALLDSYNIRFPAVLSISEDRIVNINAFRHAKNISYLHADFYIYRIHNESSSHRFIPDAFCKFTDFIQFLEIDLQRKYSGSIGNEIIRDFFSSWSMDFFHKDCKAPFFSRVKKIKDITKTETFQKAARNANRNCMPFIIRFELFLIMHKIHLPIYAHGLKALLIKNLHK